MDRASERRRGRESFWNHIGSEDGAGRLLLVGEKTWMPPSALLKKLVAVGLLRS